MMKKLYKMLINFIQSYEELLQIQTHNPNNILSVENIISVRTSVINNNILNSSTNNNLNTNELEDYEQEIEVDEGEKQLNDDDS